MPISSDVVNEVNIYLLTYNETPTLQSKKDKIDQVMKKITLAAQKKASDDEWIQIILELRKLADENQKSDSYCSHFTETLHMVALRLLREIDKTTLAAVIKNQNEQLTVLKEKYIHAKKINNAIQIIEGLELELDVKLSELAYLGDLMPLLRNLSMDEMRRKGFYEGSVIEHAYFGALYKRMGWSDESIKKYEYSATSTIYSIPNVNIHLPLVLQHGNENLTYERIYLEKTKNFAGIRPGSEKKDEPATSAIMSKSSESEEKHAHTDKKFEVKIEQKIEADISLDFARSLTQDLNHYAEGKTHGFRDALAKMRDCALYSEKIIGFAQRKAPTQEWLNLIIEMGEQSHNAQIDDQWITANGTLKTCSGFTEVFWLVIHKLRAQISKTAVEELAERQRDEFNALVALQEKAAIAKLDNASPSTVQQYELSINKAIFRLAFLGNLDPMLSIRINTLQQKVAYGSYEYNIFGRQKVSFGYEYSDKSHPYGLKNDANICTYLPLCFQPEFVEIYAKKYETKLKTLIDAKTAGESVDITIKELSAQLDTLSNDIKIKKIIELQNAEDKILGHEEITPELLRETLAPQILDIEARLKGTQKFINENTGSRAKELSLKLEKQNERMSGFLTALNKVQEVYRKAEISAAEKAAKNIESLKVIIAKLIQDPVYSKILALQDQSAMSIEEAGVTTQHTAELIQAVNALDHDIEAVKTLLSKAGIVNSSIFTKNNLEPELEKLQQLISAANRINGTFESAKREREKDIEAAAQQVVSLPVEEKAESSHGLVLTLLKPLTPRAALSFEIPAGVPEAVEAPKLAAEIIEPIDQGKERRLELYEKLYQLRKPRLTKEEQFGKWEFTHKSNPKFIPAILKEIETSEVAASNLNQYNVASIP